MTLRNQLKQQIELLDPAKVDNFKPETKKAYIDFVGMIQSFTHLKYDEI